MDSEGIKNAWTTNDLSVNAMRNDAATSSGKVTILGARILEAPTFPMTLSLPSLT